MPAVHARPQHSHRNSNKRHDGNQSVVVDSRIRYDIFYYMLATVLLIFIVRLFYLQVIQHDYYKNQAIASQLKEYEIQPTRGNIYAKDGDQLVPLVLNEIKYTLVADPYYIEDAENQANTIATIINKDRNDVYNALTKKDTRYSLVAKKLDKQQKEKIEENQFKGIVLREQSYRTYPQGGLASQLLGFVNDEGKGQYGIEQYFDSELAGQPGRLKAITDASGVPLVANKENVLIDPVPGKDIVLSIDITLQRQTEEMLKKRIEISQSPSGSVVIMNPNNGQVVAMANYPTYEPGKINDISDISILSNPSVTEAFEVGSTMKPLTAATAFDVGAITENSSFFDPGYVEVDGSVIKNVGSSYGTQNPESILVHSYNTGVVWMLKQMGGGSLNTQARNTLYDYDTNHYFFGSPTGVEQIGESSGYVQSPEDNGAGINLTYGNMTFGQALTATPIQMTSALSAVINGGDYYVPTLVDGFKDAQGNVTQKEAVIRKSGVFSHETGDIIRKLMSKVVEENNVGAMRDGYQVGGKTGTAEIAKPDGGYYDDRYNGTYLGFVAGETPKYVIFVKINTPQIPGYAGYVAAAPLFKDIANMLFDTQVINKR